MSLQGAYDQLIKLHADHMLKYAEQAALLDKYRTSFDTLYDKLEKVENQSKIDTEKYSRDLNESIGLGNRRVADTVQNYENWIKSRSFNLLTVRVIAWGTRVLGKAIMESRWERVMRLLEEALELAQVEKISVAEVDFLVKRVFSRPVGEFTNEVGGVMVCMVALAHAAQIDLIEILSKEVDRIEKLDPEAVRAKQRRKWDAGVGINPDV